MITDRVGDFIVRLKNAAASGRPSVSLPHSKHLEAIARKLSQLGFVGAVSKEGEEKKTLTVALVYNARGEAAVHGANRISKPGRRLYVPHASAHSVKNGAGARIVSTPKGILSDAEARKMRVGGEDLFIIW
jgi:small subunit ribosomal protein S8